jgi:hypothetical protein
MFVIRAMLSSHVECAIYTQPQLCTVVERVATSSWQIMHNDDSSPFQRPVVGKHGGTLACIIIIILASFYVVCFGHGPRPGPSGKQHLREIAATPDWVRTLFVSTTSTGPGPRAMWETTFARNSHAGLGKDFTKIR